MNIKICCVGKLKDSFYIAAAAEYEKRLSRYCSVEVCEVADEKTPDSMSAAEESRRWQRRASGSCAASGATSM